MTLNKGAWDFLNNKFGGKFARGDEKDKFAIDVIPFDSPTLSDASGFGGIPKGIITQFHGPEGSGKTFAAMLAVKKVLDSDPTAEVAWFDAEFAFQTKWALKMGIDLQRVHIMRDNNGTSIFEAIVGIPGKKEAKPTPGLLDLICAGKLNVQLIVLDSIAAIIPPVEEGRGVGDQNMSPLARFLPTALRMTLSKLSKSKCGMICINQARDVIGAMVPTLTYPGGRSYRHNISMAILFNASQAKSTSLFDAKGAKIGHKVICTVEKTRGTTNKAKAEVWFDFKNGKLAKLGEEAALLGVAYGLVKRPTNTKWEYNGEEITGKDNFFDYLESNPDVMSKLITDCRAAKDNGYERPEALSEESQGGPTTDIFDGEDDTTGDDA
jgi:recombination protein RecA